VFWVISLYFNIRNTLPKSGRFLLGHPVYIYIHTYIRTGREGEWAMWEIIEERSRVSRDWRKAR
jgi:hypothetical protein